MQIYEKFPEFRCQGFTLREINLEKDLKNYFDIIRQPETRRYVVDTALPSNHEEARKELKYWYDLFNNKASFYWAVVLEETGEFIGSCGFNNWNTSLHRAEISYEMSPEYWGQGIMTESLQKVIDFGFKEMKLSTIVARVAPGNNKSAKLLLRLGFTIQGYDNKKEIINGQLENIYLFTLEKKGERKNIIQQFSGILKSFGNRRNIFRKTNKT